MTCLWVRARYHHQRRLQYTTLSDGTVQDVFDAKTSALTLMHTMRGNRSWQCYASEDVICVAVGYAKLLVMQTSLVNQRLLHQYCPVYMGGLGRWAHRNTSHVSDTADALRSVGSPVARRLVSNADLAQCITHLLGAHGGAHAVRANEHAAVRHVQLGRLRLWLRWR